MPIFMQYDGIDGRFNQDSFEFSHLTAEPPVEAKPSLAVKFDNGGPAAGTDYSGSHALYQDVFIPSAQNDDGLLLPAVQTDFGLLLPY